MLKKREKHSGLLWLDKEKSREEAVVKRKGFLPNPPTKRQREEELIYTMYLGRPSPPLIDRPFAILQREKERLYEASVVYSPSFGGIFFQTQRKR
jgi:hypothetical protein